MNHQSITKIINKAVKTGEYNHHDGAAIIHLCNAYTMAFKWARKAKIILTDPPYLIPSGGNNLTRNVKNTNAPNKGVMANYDNSGQIVHCKTNWHQVMQFLYVIAADDAEIIVFTNTSCLTDSLIAARKAGFKEHNMMVWNKQRVMPTRNRMKAYEPILYLYKGRTRDANHHDRSNILSYRLNQGARASDHRTEKPLDLMVDLITNHSNEGDVIFDPFFGSGTTALAAMRTNRKFIGAEITDKYFKSTIKRLMQVPPSMPQYQIDMLTFLGVNT